jgi:hypothetical protein
VALITQKIFSGECHAGDRFYRKLISLQTEIIAPAETKAEGLDNRRKAALENPRKENGVFMRGRVLDSQDSFSIHRVLSEIKKLVGMLS